MSLYSSSSTEDEGKESSSDDRRHHIMILVRIHSANNYIYPCVCISVMKFKFCK